MRAILLAALFAAGTAFNADGTSFCPETYTDLEWPLQKPGIVCRCIPATIDSGRTFDDCTVEENSADCENAFEDDGGGCAWSVYDWSGETLDDKFAENVDTGEGWVETDGTVIDCNGNAFSAEECKYRNHGDCMDYLGDGICDFGQRFTIAGVRTGPNFACAKFNQDKGDCDCKDTMTCDGYCLDDNACKKDDYGFLTCADWYEDNVCDYGQRTSDFGVSINFDCKITCPDGSGYGDGSTMAKDNWDGENCIANVPALANLNFDKGFCEEWDWFTWYDKQTLLDNFKAECPEPQPTNEPTTKEPTHDPTEVVTKDPTKYPTSPPEEDCSADPDCWCPSNIHKGEEGKKACCDKFPEYKDSSFSCQTKVVTPAPGFECDGSLGKTDCPAVGFDHCLYDKTRPKSQRCYARPVNPCTFRFEEGSSASSTWIAAQTLDEGREWVHPKSSHVGDWDEKSCKKDGKKSKAGVPANMHSWDGKQVYCLWASTMGYKRIDVPSAVNADEPDNKTTDGEADAPTGQCIAVSNTCEEYYNKKLCEAKASRNGDFCMWSVAHDKCVEWPNASCQPGWKKKICKGWGDTLGCRYGKKGGKDKPFSGTALRDFSGDKSFDGNGGICYHWSDVCYADGQDCGEQNGKPTKYEICPDFDNDPNCANSQGIKYKKPPKKAKFKSCAKSGKNEKTCQAIPSKHNCMWDGDKGECYNGNENLTDGGR